MTRQQRITLEQVRAKKNEALGRMNDVLKKIGETPIEDTEQYHQLLRALGHARRDFDTWSTVFDTLDTAREFPLSYPGLNEAVDEDVEDEIASYWVDDSSVVTINSKWVSLVSEPSGGIIAVGRRDVIISLADLLQQSAK
jgi:hypothetical protein